MWAILNKLLPCRWLHIYNGCQIEGLKLLIVLEVGAIVL